MNVPGLALKHAIFLKIISFTIQQHCPILTLTGSEIDFAAGLESIFEENCSRGYYQFSSSTINLKYYFLKNYQDNKVSKFSIPRLCNAVEI